MNINGVAGGASAGPAGIGVNDTGAVTDSQPAGDQQQRTPRKSKSMGRIHGGGTGPEVGGGGAAGGPAEASGGGTQQQHDQAPPAPGPDTAAPTQHWHRGHRRTPSDGVAWRHSKGTHATTSTPHDGHAEHARERDREGWDLMYQFIIVFL